MFCNTKLMLLTEFSHQTNHFHAILAKQLLHFVNRLPFAKLFNCLLVVKFDISGKLTLDLSYLFDLKAV